jgi:3-hydroxyacyl-CoA dehydrogenase
MFWADTLGSRAIFEQITSWHERYGERWKPSNLLREIAEQGGSFREAKGTGVTV